MNGHTAIFARLSGFAGISALVSARIYPDIMPSPPVMPAITYHLIHSSTERGALSDPPLATGLFQVTSWGKSRLEARTVAAQVMTALDRWRQTTVAGVQIDDCIFQSDLDLYDAETKSYYVAADYRLHFRE